MHSPTLDKLRAAPLALAALALNACTGTSTGSPDADAAGRTAEQAQQFAISNGRLIAAALVATGGVLLIKFLWQSWPVRIILTAVVTGVVVYLAMGGGK